MSCACIGCTAGALDVPCAKCHLLEMVEKESLERKNKTMIVERFNRTFTKFIEKV